MMGFIGAASVMAIRGIWSHLTTPTADIQEYINVIRHCDMQNFVYSQQTNVMQINEVARDCWRGCDMFDKDRDKNAEITSEQQECMNKCTQLRMKFLQKTQEIQHARYKELQEEAIGQIQAQQAQQAQQQARR